MSDSPEPPIPSAGLVFRVKPKHLVGFLVGVALFVLVLRWLAPNWEALRASATFDWRFALIGLLGTTLASFATAARWRLLAEVMGGTKLGFATYFFSLAGTRVLGQFLPTVAVDLYFRGFALRSAGSTRSIGHAATQVVLERLFDFVLPIMLLAWAITVRREWLPFAPAVTLALFCGVFLLLAIPLLRPGVRVALRVYLAAKLRINTLLRREIEAEAETELAETPGVDAKLATRIALLSLARYATVVLQFWGIARAVGIQIGWDEMTAASSIQQIAGILSLTPGGLGILEAGWAGGLGWIGLERDPIGLFVLVQRLGIIVFFGLLTVLSWPLAARDKRELEAARARDPKTHG